MKSSYDNIPKLLITCHGKWNVPVNYKKKGHPTFKLPYNTRIMYATGMGVVNYLDQTVPNMINKEYKKNSQYGLKKIRKFKKDLKSFDLYGCCHNLACKDNRRLNAPTLRDIQEQEKDSDNSDDSRADATAFLDNCDKPYRITSKKKGNDMPIKSFSIMSEDFGKYDDGTNVRDITNLNDNRIILYIPGHLPIDVLYHWGKHNENEPYITAKLNNSNIELSLKTVLERVKIICSNLGIDLKDLDIIDLSCNITLDYSNETAPKDINAREKYTNKLKDLIFGEDEVSSSSSEEENVDFSSMLSQYPSSNKKTPKKKKQNSTKKTRREYIRK
jgi:hypothetical protein